MVAGSIPRGVRRLTMKHGDATWRALLHGRRPAGRRPVWLGSEALNLRMTLAPGVRTTGIGTPNLHYYDTFHIFFEYVAVSVATALCVCMSSPVLRISKCSLHGGSD